MYIHIFIHILHPDKVEVKFIFSNILFLSSIQGQVEQIATNIYVKTAIYKDKMNPIHL